MEILNNIFDRSYYILICQWEYIYGNIREIAAKRKNTLKVFLNIKDGEHMPNFRERLKFTFQTA